MNKVLFRNKKGFINYNSFLVNFPRDEYMVHIAEMKYLNGKCVDIFICLDLFSKYAYGIEMPTKDPNTSALILKICIK